MAAPKNKKAKKPDDRMRVLLALRTSLEKAASILGDSFSLASDTPICDVAPDVERAEKSVHTALKVLEEHWPTRSDACSRCETGLCTCYHTCMEDPETGCSLSGDFHVHAGEPCPVHPDAPGDR